MFNLGSDDKDELQENMKEIKNMIQRDDGNSRAQQGTQADTGFGGSGSQQDQGFGNSDNSSQGFGNNNKESQNFGNEDSSGQEGFGNRNSPGLGEEKPEAGTESSGPSGKILGQESRSGKSGSRGRERKSSMSAAAQSDTGRNTQRGQKQQQTASPESPGSREKVEQHDQEPEENEEKESRRKVIRSEPKKESSDSSPDEPLFLREEQFRDVREMVEEMSYLSQEISENLDRMKKSVDKERDNSQNVGELVDAYSQRRSSIESTIESGQK